MPAAATAANRSPGQNPVPELPLRVTASDVAPIMRAIRAQVEVRGQ
ncbi:hypothetical protein ACIO53_03305 [Streptomyces sp. NPDC087305]